MSSQAPIDVFANKNFVDLATGMPHWHMSHALTLIVPETVILDDFVKPDKDTKSAEQTIIETGSSAEGLRIPIVHRRQAFDETCTHSHGDEQQKLGQYGGPLTTSGDADLMVCIAGITVGDHTENTMVLDTDNTHPGYTMLRAVDKSTLATFLERALDESYICTSNSTELEIALKSGLYLRNKLPILFRLRIGHKGRIVAGETSHTHGPAATFTSESCTSTTDVMGHSISLLKMDGVLCFSCPVWPSVAAKWITRPRHAGWPSKEQISSIHHMGCDVVPVGHHLSSASDVEWRFSFSRAEIMLAQSLSPAQKRTYLIFKIACNAFLEGFSFVSTYHLKTLFFWACEKIPGNHWTTDRLFANLLYLLDTLKLALLQHRISNFFIPENNMIDHVPRNAVSLAAKSAVQLRLHVISILNDYFRKHSISWSTLNHVDTQRTFVLLTNERQFYQNNVELASEFVVEILLALAKFYADGFEREVSEILTLYKRLQCYIIYHKDVYHSLNLLDLCNPYINCHIVDIEFSEIEGVEVGLPNNDPILQIYPDDMISTGQWIFEKLFPPEDTCVAQKNFKTKILFKIAEFCHRRAVAASSMQEQMAFVSKARSYFEKGIAYTKETTDSYTLAYLCKYSNFLYHTGHYQECIGILEDIILKHQLHLHAQTSVNVIQIYQQYESVQLSLLRQDVLDTTLQMLLSHDPTKDIPCFWFAVYLLVRCHCDANHEDTARQVLEQFEQSYKEFQIYQMGADYLAILSLCYFHLKDYHQAVQTCNQIVTDFAEDSMTEFCKEMQELCIKYITEEMELEN